MAVTMLSTDLRGIFDSLPGVLLSTRMTLIQITLILLHSELPKLYGILAVLSAIGLKTLFRSKRTLQSQI